MVDFTYIVCEQCGGTGTTTLKTWVTIMKKAGYSDIAIGLIVCLQKFDATCHVNYDLPLHVIELNNELNMLVIETDLSIFWKESKER